MNAQNKSWLDKNRKLTEDSKNAFFYQTQETDSSINLIKEETFYASNDPLFSKGYLEQMTAYPIGA